MQSSMTRSEGVNRNTRCQYDNDGDGDGDGELQYQVALEVLSYHNAASIEEVISIVYYYYHY